MKKIRDIESRKKWMRQAKQVCFICGKPAGGFGFWLDCAHIVGGSGRSDLWANLTLAHSVCHQSTHGITTILGGVKLPGYHYTTVDLLKGKLKYDPENWDLAALEELKGSPMPWRGDG